VFQAILKKEATITHLHLQGVIDETTEFEQAIGPLAGAVVVHGQAVPNINSAGVRNWVQYFMGITAQGVRLTFVECSVTLVQQMSAISNFSAGAPVQSIYVPYLCGQCKAEFVGLMQCADIKKLNKKLPPTKCSKCGGEAVFDEIESEYFLFLDRQ